MNALATLPSIRHDPALWADFLGISRAAVDVYLASDVIDQHIDSFLWHRMGGYDLHRYHQSTWLRGSLFSQVDLPRLHQAAIGGAVWIVTTNVGVAEERRPRVLIENLHTITSLLATQGNEVAVVGSWHEYQQARAQSKHAAFLGVQGANAVGQKLDVLDHVPSQLIRMTLVHLTTSNLGGTSFPWGGDTGDGLTRLGHELVERMNEKRIFVDLAHANRRTFFDVARVHPKTIPLLVTHTGVAGVFPHWRNVDDDQIRAIADTGGTIGIIFHSSYLGDATFRGRVSSVVDHMAHVIKLVGDDHVALGSDWDGAIVTPRDMPTCSELPRLAQAMLDRGWSAVRIQKILGGNVLRTLRALRG